MSNNSVRERFGNSNRQLNYLIFKVFFVIFTILVPNFTFNSSLANAIEGGFKTNYSKFIVPIAVSTAPGRTATCSGIALNSKIVATAAHCVFDRSGSISSLIRVGNPGASYLFTEANLSTWSKVTTVKSHDSFSKSGASGDNYDIAFLELATNLVGVVPISILDREDFSEIVPLQTKLIVLGYGQINMQREWPEFPYELRGNLKKTYNSNEFIFISSTGRICGGDSGGPVFIEEGNELILLGLVSRSGDGDPCGTYDFVATAIEPYLYIAESLGYVSSAQILAQISYIEETLSSSLNIFYDLNNKFQKLPKGIKKLFEKDGAWPELSNYESTISKLESISLTPDTDLEIIEESSSLVSEFDEEIVILLDLWANKIDNKYCLNRKNSSKFMLKIDQCPKGYRVIK